MSNLVFQFLFLWKEDLSNVLTIEDVILVTSNRTLMCQETKAQLAKPYLPRISIRIFYFFPLE